jgi:NADH-quinone oxidoreductase subunit N
MAIYVAMTIGMFACLLALRTDAGYVENIDDMAGAAQNRPIVAAVMAILMFSLIGMPPLAGFFAKWHAFVAAIDAQLYVLAVIGMLASAVSAFYYLRIVKVMYFDEPVREFEVVPSELGIIIGLVGFVIVTYYFTVGSPLANFAHTAAVSLF